MAAACGGTDQFQIDGSAAEIFPGECVGGNDDEVTIYSGRKENLIEPVLDAFTCATGISVQVRWKATAARQMFSSVSLRDPLVFWSQKASWEQ